MSFWNGQRNIAICSKMQNGYSGSGIFAVFDFKDVYMLLFTP